MSVTTSKIADHLRGDHVVEVAGEGAGEPQDGVVLLPRVAQVLDQSEVSTGGCQPITAHLDLAVQLRVHRAVGLADVELLLYSLFSFVTLFR